MTTWYTADLHFGHRRIIELAERPFSSVQDMDEIMIARWNERVQPEDTVFVLGDYALGHLDTTMGYTRRLTGHKVLIAGNHDRCFPGFAKPGGGRSHREWAHRYRNFGFTQVIWENSDDEVDDPDLGRVQLSHFPYVGDSHDTDRYSEYRPLVQEGGPGLLLHGHVHTAWQIRESPHPMVNVGVDVWDFAPVSGAQIEAALP